MMVISYKRNCVKRMDIDLKSYIMYDFICKIFWKRLNCRYINVLVVVSNWEWGEGLIIKEGILESKGIVLYFTYLLKFVELYVKKE